MLLEFNEVYWKATEKCSRCLKWPFKADMIYQNVLL